MNQTEDRLRRAAAETRQLAGRRQPAMIPATQSSGHQGWLVLAAAFAVVLAVFGALPLLLDSTPDTSPAATSPLAVPSATTTTPRETSSCSAAGFESPTSGPPSLPEPVAATRAAIIDAASDCDFDRLEARADESFVTSFGGGGVGSLREWESQGSGELDTLLEVLYMSYEVVETDGGGAIYVWPSAYVYGTWDEIPDDVVGELRAIHSEEELASMADAKGYLGWRTAIDSEGRWLYFVAGD